MIHGLDNISVVQLYHLPSDDFKNYMELQGVMASKPMFRKMKAKKIESLEFGQVAQLKRIMLKPTYQGLVDAFKMVYGVKQSEYQNANVLDYFYALNHIKHSVTALVKKELKALNSEPDMMMQMAGADRLNVFAELNTLIDIGKQFGKAPEEVERWPYSMVFALVLHNKISGEVMKRYHELKSKKNGPK